MHPDNIPFLIGCIASGIFSLILGTMLGWIFRSIFVARDIERAARQTWKQARTLTRHGAEL
jgi:hypothetical protein